ncbi:hypothetical protein ACFX13_036180 [Malus domestica]
MFQPLWRIGLGLTLASGSMSIAALVEAKRCEAAHNDVILPVFWLGWQFLLLGVCDVPTFGGMFEFFYSDAKYHEEYVHCIVMVFNIFGNVFGGDDLNLLRSDLFCTLLAILSTVNFLNYMYWAKRY